MDDDCLFERDGGEDSALKVIRGNGIVEKLDDFLFWRLVVLLDGEVALYAFDETELLDEEVLLEVGDDEDGDQA